MSSKQTEESAVGLASIVAIVETSSYSHGNSRGVCPRRGPSAIISLVRIVVTALRSGRWRSLGGARAHPEDIYRWTDEQGNPLLESRRHLVARIGSAPPESGTREQGWESVLEKHTGDGDFQDKAEAVINDLQLQLIRKKRDRDQAREALETTQASIVRAQSAGATDVPMLERARQCRSPT